MQVKVKTLSTYKVDPDGKRIGLDVVDDAGDNVTLSLDIGQMGMLAMTLPGLIEAALRKQYGDTTLRFSYPLGSWLIEPSSDRDSLIVTLRTTDEFGISFSMHRKCAERLSEDVVAQAARAVEVVSH